MAGEAGTVLRPEQVGDGRGEVAEADGISNDPAGGDAPGSDDQERNAHLLLIQADAVAKAFVLAELLAVVGRDDHERLIEETAIAERAEEGFELRVERGDAVVVGVAGQREGIRQNGSTDDVLPLGQNVDLGAGPGNAAKAAAFPLGNNVRVMGVKIIEEREKRPGAGGSPREPVEELAIDLRGRLALEIKADARLGIGGQTREHDPSEPSRVA